MARFLLPSSSLSEDLLVNGWAAENIMTLVVEVARRVPQKVEPPVSAGSSILGVELPKANTMCDLSFFFFASIRASLSWFFRRIASLRSLSASHINRFLSSTWFRLRIDGWESEFLKEDLKLSPSLPVSQGTRNKCIYTSSRLRNRLCDSFFRRGGKRFCRGWTLCRCRGNFPGFSAVAKQFSPASY